MSEGKRESHWKNVLVITIKFSMHYAFILITIIIINITIEV